MLISCKVDINAKNVEGWTALHYAQGENQTEIRDLLCSAGAVKASSISIIDTSAIFLRYSTNKVYVIKDSKALAK